MWLNLEDNVNALSLLGALVIVVLTIVAAGKYFKQMKDDTASGELVDEKWDGIGEYLNDLPKGWAIAWIACTVWGFWYWFVGYPLNAYSQIGEWNQEVKDAQAKYESQWANADKDTLVNMGQSIFLVQCAPCHGETAEGIGGKAANLTMRLEKDTVAEVIKHGSKALGNESGQLGFPLGMMPDRNGIINMATGTPISDADIDAVATYVSKGMPSGDTAGAEMFTNYCSSCHGPDGTGMGASSPNLKTWDPAIVKAVLEHGKKGSIGMMPSFKNRFVDVQKQALTEYLLSLK